MLYYKRLVATSSTKIIFCGVHLHIVACESKELQLVMVDYSTNEHVLCSECLE